MKKITFNKVYIIASFNEREGKKYYPLCEGIISHISDVCNCELKLINNFKEWEDVWKQIENDVTKGVIPFLHLVMHGKIEGFHISKEKDIIGWSEMLNHMAQINSLSGGQLTVLLQVCYGAQCLSRLLDCKKPPFQVMISSLDKVDICKSFVSINKFYDVLLQHNLNEAVYAFVYNYSIDPMNDNRSRWCIYQFEENFSYSFRVTMIDNYLEDFIFYEEKKIL